MTQEEYDLVPMLVKVISIQRNFPFDIEIHYTNDINADILKYLHREKTQKEYSQKDFSKYNGVAIPFENHGFHVLINNNSNNSISTIIHETTHVIDFYEFMVEYNNGEINIEDNDYYWGFCLYSEFHARYQAHKNFLKFMLEEKTPKNIEINELTKIINEIYLDKGDFLSIDDFYNLMQYLGRWLSIEEVCHESYNLPHYNDLYDLLCGYMKTKNIEYLDMINSIFR